MKRGVVIIIAVVSLSLGILLRAQWDKLKSFKIASNRFALETALTERLAEYHSKNSRYPASLDEIEIPWIRSAERRKMLLLPFYYENRGDTYVLWWPKTDIEN